VGRAARCPCWQRCEPDGACSSVGSARRSRMAGPWIPPDAAIFNAECCGSTSERARQREVTGARINSSRHSESQSTSCYQEALNGLLWTIGLGNLSVVQRWNSAGQFSREGRMTNQPPGRGGSPASVYSRARLSLASYHRGPFDAPYGRCGAVITLIPARRPTRANGCKADRSILSSTLHLERNSCGGRSCYGSPRFHRAAAMLGYETVCRPMDGLERQTTDANWPISYSALIISARTASTSRISRQAR